MDISASDPTLATAAQAPAIRALLDRRTPAGYWEGRLSSSALATATAVTALAVAERSGVGPPDGRRLVTDGLHWLATTQHADGAWGDTPGSPGNISTTALAWAALAFGDHERFGEPAARAASWLAAAAGGREPAAFAAAVAARYGKDRTFSVPILTMCAIAGRLGPADRAWPLIPQLPFELAVLPRRWFGTLRLPVVSYALPALISMGLARHRRGAAIPVISRVRERIAARVLRVLDGLQPPNGGFLEAVPLTSFVAMSLVAAGESSHPAVRRGLDFLIRSARRDGSWPIDSNLATWVTTLAVNALAAGGGLGTLPQSDRDRIRDWLLGQQWTAEHPYTAAKPGGWAWTDLPGGVPDADDTAGALLALSHLGPPTPPVLHAAVLGVRWLVDLQNDDGGMPTFCRGWGTLPFDRSASDLTAHAVRAWRAWDAHLDPSLQRRTRVAARRAIRFLACRQRGDGAFVPLWFGNQQADGEENPVFGTARVVKGLSVLEDDPVAARVLRRARDWLLAQQNADGGWGAAAGVPSSIEETGVTVAALCTASAAEPEREAAARGRSWLEGATGGTRRVPPSPIGLYFARLWYSEALYPLIFAAEAAAAGGEARPS